MVDVAEVVGLKRAVRTFANLPNPGNGGNPKDEGIFAIGFEQLLLQPGFLLFVIQILSGISPRKHRLRLW